MTPNNERTIASVTHLSSFAQYVFPLGNDNDNLRFLAVIALSVTTIFELLPSILDDNITIPVVYGVTYSLLIYF